METNLLLFKRFDDVEEGHEELVKLSLSTLTSASPSKPVSSSSSIGQQELGLPFNSNSRKRWFSSSLDGEEDHQELLTLSIGPPEPPSLFPSTSQDKKRACTNNPNLEPVVRLHAVSAAGSGGSSYHQRPRVRRNPHQAPKGAEKSDTIVAPYPWATTRRATVHSLENLLSRGISMISGHLECKECQETFKIEYNLQEKFKEIKDFVSVNKSAMHQRAPQAWQNPKLDTCGICGSNLKPVITKKRDTNWLFLLLGQMLGCCKLAELKYFCKHTENHRTGAKDRLLYLTYLALCKQLDPDGPFAV